MPFDPKRKAEIVLTDEAPRTTKELKQPRVANQTDAERIAAVKARMKASCKARNLPGAQYSFEYRPEYFQDYIGPETSTYDFEHLFFMLSFLEDPKWRLLSCNHRDGNYNARTGIWTRGDLQISIGELKQAVAERIRELGISELLLTEYLAESRSIEESQQFYALSFNECMDKLRESKS